MGTSGGEIIVATTDGRPIKRFNAHKGFVFVLFCFKWFKLDCCFF